MNDYDILDASSILCFSNKKDYDETGFGIQLPMDDIDMIVSYHKDNEETYQGKLLITFMLDGKVREMKCDSIIRKRGELLLVNPQRVSYSVDLCLMEDYNVPMDFLEKNVDGYRNKTMCYDLLKIIQIEPYPERLKSDKSDKYIIDDYDWPIGKIWGELFIINKTIHLMRQDSFQWSNCVLEFPSITEMFGQIMKWKNIIAENQYPLSISDIKYDSGFYDSSIIISPESFTDVQHAIPRISVGSFTITSESFTYTDLEKKLGIKMKIQKKMKSEYQSSENDYKKWIDDAYEGYSPEYLGLD